MRRRSRVRPGSNKIIGGDTAGARDFNKPFEADRVNKAINYFQGGDRGANMQMQN